MSVHPQIQAMLDKMAALNLPAVQSLSPEDARAQVPLEPFCKNRQLTYLRIGIRSSRRWGI